MSSAVVIICLMLICHVACVEEKANEQFPYDYCDIVCNGSAKHTMCEYPPGGGDSCDNNLKVYLTKDEKIYIADNLNRVRLLVAQGETDGFPKASNMMKLVWDSELSMIAKRWADQCTQPKHDKCRVTSDEMQTGQNVFIGTYQTTAKGMSQRLSRIKSILDNWEKEKKLFDMKWLDKYNSSTEDTAGNFSQIIWAITDSVGCGYTEFDMKTYIMTRFVCNFKRKGNLDDRSVYRKGEPCSSCPMKNPCSESYTGLCWNGKLGNYHDEDDGGGTTGLESTIVLVMVAVTILVLHSQRGL